MFKHGEPLAIFAARYFKLSPTQPQNPAQEPPQTPQDCPQKPSDSPRWPRNGPQNVRQSTGKSGDHMFGCTCLAILGHLGTTWAHLGLLSLPNCHPISPLEASVADRRDPRTCLASFAKPLTCQNTFKYNVQAR